MDTKETLIKETTKILILDLIKFCKGHQVTQKITDHLQTILLQIQRLITTNSIYKILKIKTLICHPINYIVLQKKIQTTNNSDMILEIV